MMVKHTWW